MGFYFVHFKSILLIAAIVKNSVEADDSSAARTNCGDFQCTGEGYFDDAKDCKKFHRCMDWNSDGISYDQYDFYCPEGVEFDQSISVCNYPENIPSASCKICNPEGRINGKRPYQSESLETRNQNLHQGFVRSPARMPLKL